MAVIRGLRLQGVNLPSVHDLLAWGYSLEYGYRLIVVNYSAAQAQGKIKLPWAAMREQNFALVDELQDQSYERAGRYLLEEGLYVDLHSWDAHWFAFSFKPSTTG